MKKLISKLKVYRTLPICEGVNVNNGVAHFTNFSTWLSFNTTLDNGHYEISPYKKDVLVRTDIEFEEVPVMKDQEVKHIATITNELIGVLTKALSFIGSDKLRPVMSGVYVSSKGICATDAHKLYWLDIDTDFPEEGVIISTEFIKMLTRSTSVTICDKFIRATYTDYTVQCYLIEGRYPNYKAIIPKNNNEVTINRKDLIKLVNEIQHFTNKDTKRVILDFKDQNLTVSAEDIDRGVNKTSSIKTSKCIEMKIALNTSFLLIALKAINSDLVKFNLNDSPARVVILDESILLMPLMFNV